MTYHPIVIVSIGMLLLSMVSAVEATLTPVEGHPQNGGAVRQMPRMPTMPSPLVEYEIIPIDPASGLTDEVIAAMARNGFQGFTVSAIILDGPRPCVVQQRLSGRRPFDAAALQALHIPGLLPEALQQQLKAELAQPIDQGLDQ